jgi:AcrR family transcriptional regulator
MGETSTRTELRKKKIIEAAVHVIAEHGVTGMTVNRVAALVGMTAPALYFYFSSRRELLLAAMDEVIDRIRESRTTASDENVVERLRQMGANHMYLVSTQEQVAAAFLEFICAPPGEDLREELGARQLMLADELAEIVKQGQAQGTIRRELDPHQVAWAYVSRAWAVHIGHMMGIAEQFNSTRATWILDTLIDAISVPASARGCVCQVPQERRHGVQLTL